MNLESLKNMDVNDLLTKLKGQSDIFKDKKLMIKIGVGLGAILIFLIIKSFFLAFLGSQFVPLPSNPIFLT